MKVKGICYFVLSQYSVLVGLNIHAVNRPQGAYYLYPFEDRSFFQSQLCGNFPLLHPHKDWPSLYT